MSEEGIPVALADGDVASLAVVTVPAPSPRPSPGQQPGQQRDADGGAAGKPPLHPAAASAAAVDLPPSSPGSPNPGIHLTNVSSPEQLATLPPTSEFRSGDPARPLRHVDDRGDVHHYSLRPLTYAAAFILLVELLERFSFYGINYTQTAYLTGAYDRRWNAGMASVEASSYVSVSTAVAYTAPFAGAYLADRVLGDYWTIVFGSTVLYLPGVFLIALTTIPGMLGDEFNEWALALGLLFLWPVGTGIVKSVVNVFGAKQYHPILQSALIESYYVNFYMCINVGALAGGIIVPIVAQTNVSAAYFIPVVMLGLGVLCFVAGTPRYVRTRPRRRKRGKKGVGYGSSSSSTNEIGLGVIGRVSALILPFSVAYSQMATTFIVQGTVMSKACFGLIDASVMNNADAVSVLFFGYVVGNKLYPALARRGIKIATTQKFAIGSLLGTLAIGWALVVEYWIHSVYGSTGGPVSVLWQAPSYVLIGAGEIFAVSAAYEVAFTAAPPRKKALASAVNLFFVGGLPNIFCIGLYHACRAWFRNAGGDTSISTLRQYSEAHVSRYFWVLLIIALMGVAVNLLPSVRDWVSAVEERAADAVRTPISTPDIRKRLKLRAAPPPPRRDLSSSGISLASAAAAPEEEDEDEEAPLVRARRHEDYLRYGSGPVLYKQGSMRAGPCLSHSERQTKKERRAAAAARGAARPYSGYGGALVVNRKGEPVRAGAVHGPKEVEITGEKMKALVRSHSDV